MSYILRIFINDGFTTEDKLFIIQFPRLYAICSLCEIARETVSKLYDYMSCIYKTRNEFCLALRMILVYLYEDIPVKGRRILFEYNKFQMMNVIFKKNNGNIEIKF